MTSIASARVRPRPTAPRRRSCPPRTARWSPRSSRRSTISSWASSSYLRILSGRIASDTTLVNLRSGKTAKAGHIYVLQGKQQEEVPEAIAGDIVAIAKFDDLHVSDTVSNVGGNTTVPQLRVRPIKFPIPMVPRAVEPKARDDEAEDLGRAWPRSPTRTRPSRSAAMPRRTSW